jgi:hypothetical protein
LTRTNIQDGLFCETKRPLNPVRPPQLAASFIGASLFQLTLPADPIA